MLEKLGLQSWLQYNRLREQVAAHIETGEIVNHSTEKVSAFEQSDPKMVRSVSTQSVTKRTKNASENSSQETDRDDKSGAATPAISAAEHPSR